MTSEAVGKRLTLRRHRRWAFDLLMVESTVPPILIFAGRAIGEWSGPVDYRWFAAPMIITAVIWAFLVLPAFLYRLTLGRRHEQELTAEGIQSIDPASAPVQWSDIVGIKAAWGLTGRRVLVTRRSRRKAVTLYAPRTGWRPDPRFDREVAGLRERAAEYGAGIDSSGPPKPRSPAKAVLAVLAAILAVAGVRTVVGGAVFPWTRIASLSPKACPGLIGAGMNRLWPIDQREVITARDLNFGSVNLSECQWGDKSLGTEGTAFDIMKVAVWQYKPDQEDSAVAMARRDYNTTRADAPRYDDLDGVGDEAVMGSSSQRATVIARKANILVHVSVVLDQNDEGEAKAVATARSITESIIGGVSLDSTEIIGEIRTPGPAATLPR